VITDDYREVPGPRPEEPRPFEPTMHNLEYFDAGDGLGDDWQYGLDLFYGNPKPHVLPTYITAWPQELALQEADGGKGRVTGFPAVVGPLENKAQEVHIARPPAHVLRSVLELVMSRKAYERIIRPYFADEFHEYCEALRAGDRRRALVIAVRMRVIIWYNVVAAVVASVVRPIKELIR
jgi:hypothetical protein